jgi:hypothetical protein
MHSVAMQMARQLAMLRTVMSAIPPMSHTLIAGHGRAAGTAGASDTTAFSAMVGTTVLWVGWARDRSRRAGRARPLADSRLARNQELGEEQERCASSDKTGALRRRPRRACDGADGGHDEKPPLRAVPCWPLATPGLATSTENEPWPAVSRISVKLPRSSRFIFGSNAILGRSGEARAMLGRHGGAVQYP